VFFDWLNCCPGGVWWGGGVFFWGGLFRWSGVGLFSVLWGAVQFGSGGGFWGGGRGVCLFTLSLYFRSFCGGGGGFLLRMRDLGAHFPWRVCWESWPCCGGGVGFWLIKYSLGGGWCCYLYQRDAAMFRGDGPVGIGPTLWLGGGGAPRFLNGCTPSWFHARGGGGWPAILLFLWNWGVGGGANFHRRWGPGSFFPLPCEAKPLGGWVFCADLVLREWSTFLVLFFGVCAARVRRTPSLARLCFVGVLLFFVCLRLECWGGFLSLLGFGTRGGGISVCFGGWGVVCLCIFSGPQEVLLGGGRMFFSVVWVFCSCPFPGVPWRKICGGFFVADIRTYLFSRRGAGFPSPRC